MIENIVLDVKNLTTGYDHNIIMKDISFSVRRGEMIGIIGPNGAGKSTLLKTLRGFIPCQRNQVFLQGRDIVDLNIGEFACRVAYLQQHETLVPGYTVREIVAAGRYPRMKWWQHENVRDNAVIEASMSFTGVAGLSGRDVDSLSGGQLQRVLLAKILAQQTDILFLDEPAIGLDVFYQEEIFNLCSVLCRQGKTILLVAHELPLAARFCSRLLLLGNGGMAAMGNNREVLTEENLTAVYGVPIHVSENELTGHCEVYGVASDISGRQEMLDVLMNRDGGEAHEK